MSDQTTPPLRGTSPPEGNAHPKDGAQNSPPLEGWQAKPDGVVPKLRFPEFRDAGEWEEKKLGSLVEIFSGDAPSSHKLNSAHCCPYVKVEDMNNCSKYQSKSREYAENSTMSLPVGAVLFPKRGAAIMGNKVRISVVPFYIDSNMMALFPRKASCLSQEFLYYLILIQQLSKIADTSSIPQINNKHIIAHDVVIPAFSEQQKIADCLTSIDELLALETQKLAALKAHKKGLMQQLFPAEGETLPKLRFPEFRDAGEWEEKALGAICDYWNGASHEGGVTENGSYYLISLNSIDIDGNLKPDMKRLLHTDNSLKKNDLVMVLSDVAHGNLLGLSDIIPDDYFVLNQRMAGLRLKDASVGEVNFLRVYINNNQPYFKQKGQGSSQLNLSKSSVTDFPVLLPNLKEQQKIADCLSSLDDLITAQTQKIDTLKAHKKGLMQQLFPSVGGVAGEA